jgi:hypothetical protein
VEALSRCTCISAATFSPCRSYRYTLTRSWGPSVGGHIVFIGLNPSTADEMTDDATIRREIGFAKRIGHTCMHKLNIFGRRSTDPMGLMEPGDPIGPDNDRHLFDLASDVRATVIACWGSHRKGALGDVVRGRADFVAGELTRRGIGMLCFGTNADGAPKHPLYLPGDTPLRVYQVAR